MSLLSSVMAQIIRAGGPPPVGGDWTPAEITTALWLDAADTGTVTLNAGAVEQWDDKSGNARHVSQTATPSLRPGYTSGVSVNFNGDILWRSSAFAYALGGMTLFSVVKWTASGGNVLFGEGKSSTSNTFYDLRRSSAAMTQFIRADGGGILLTVNALGPAPTGSTFKIVSWRDSGTEMQGWVNGVVGGTPRTYARSLALTPDQFAVGGIRFSTSNGEMVVAELSEMLIVPGAADTDTRQRIEGYLAWKWGLEADLPPGHPYELAAPTI